MIQHQVDMGGIERHISLICIRLEAAGARWPAHLKPGL
jgi:hypothetical protein